MEHKRIGTMIHGALGDCYEQLCAIKILRMQNKNDKWIGFFVKKDRLSAMRHFKLDMLDEIYTLDDISRVHVDSFYLFQIHDIELRRYVIPYLPESVKTKLDLHTNRKPWQIIKKHNFKLSGLELRLSELGKEYLPLCMKMNEIDLEIFKNRFTVGYLWRYRVPGGAISPRFQHSKEWILQSKNELFNYLINKYNAHIFICGMKKDKIGFSSVPKEILDKAGVLEGEYNSKYTEHEFDLPSENCTYLKGLGFAAEMEIMSHCDLLLMMPSGFSEALWMKKKTPVLLVDPPLGYMAKIWWNRMPFFDNYDPKYAYYNTFIRHSATNVIKFLRKQKLLKK